MFDFIGSIFVGIIKFILALFCFALLFPIFGIVLVGLTVWWLCKIIKFLING